MAFQNLFVYLATICILISAAASWSLTQYSSMHDCECFGQCRRAYISYMGTGTSPCFQSGLASGGVDCLRTNDGGHTFGPCTERVRPAALGLGPYTKCTQGLACSLNAITFTTGVEGTCVDNQHMNLDDSDFICEDV